VPEGGDGREATTDQVPGMGMVLGTAGATLGGGSQPKEAEHPHGLPCLIVSWKLLSSLNPKFSSGFEHQSSICQQGFIFGALLFLLEEISGVAEDGWRLEKPSCSLQKFT